ncbi:MAG: SDR family oxidoreductase [Rhizomicrobium sp.]
MIVNSAMSDSQWLRGRKTWLIGAGLDIVSDLARGLDDLGSAIAILSDNAETLAAAPVDAQTSSASFVSQTLADAAVADLKRLAGEPDLLVMGIVPREAAELSPITALSAGQWRAQSSAGVRTLLYLLRALGPHIKDRGVAVVLVGPSLSLVGCPDLVALTTLLEGQRGLMKSVARQWGAHGVTLNWIALAPRTLSQAFGAAPLAAKPDTVSLALGRAPDLRREIAPVISFLGSPAGRVMTGATLTLDGGEWMVP